jgi:predicted GNAT superfamily acetyltransferase
VTDPWTLARERASGAGVTLAPLTTVPDAARINEVIEATWGDQHLDHEVIRALAVSGNVSWGAFDDDRLIGFVLGWAGVDEDGLHVHSHMLAAIPDHRHRGVGEALKLAQRAQALDQGIDVVRWTFDPLVARNAWLNLGKLGAIVDRFARNFYGVMTDSINVGERSDRFTVAWRLRREPGPRSLPATPPVDLLVRSSEGTAPMPADGRTPDGAVAAIEVPADYHALRAEDPAAAAAWRDAIAEAAEVCMAAGLVGAAFDRARSAYLFARPESLEDSAA